MLPRAFAIPVSAACLLIAAACTSPEAASTSGALVNDGGSGATSLDELRDALASQGLVVIEGDPIDQPFHPEPVQVLVVNSQTVQVFTFDGDGAAQAFASTIAPDASSIGTTIPTWVETPRFYLSGPMVVLYVGEDAGVTAALENVLGPPIAEGAAAIE